MYSSTSVFTLSVWRSGVLLLALAAVAAIPFAQSKVAGSQDGQQAGKSDAADQKPADDKKASLAEIQNMLIGQWRGVGQPRRGSSRDSWIETTDWSWKFADDGASLVFKTDDGKFYASGEISPGDADGKYSLIGTTSDDKQETFTGTRDDDGTLIFTATDAAEGRPARITMRNVANGDRLLILFERSLGEDRFTRLAEVGYTRQGSGFGQGASAGPECVVTGGLGTIQVEYAGKSYFVCCTGCQDLFNEDPERILAEYAKRKEEEKNKKKQD